MDTHLAWSLVYGHAMSMALLVFQRFRMSIYGVLLVSTDTQVGCGSLIYA